MIDTIVSIAARLFKLLIILREGWEVGIPYSWTSRKCHSKCQRESDLTIGEKFVETLYSIRRTSKNKKLHTPPLSPPFEVGVFAIFLR